MPVTADSTQWTADSICWTADGRIICIDADVAEAAIAFDYSDAALGANDQVDAVTDVAAAVVEAAGAVDELDAVAIAGGAVIDADVLEAASASDALDVAAVFAAVVDEPAGALDEVVAAVGAQVLSGTVDEAAAALDQLDAAVEAVPVEVVSGGAHYPRRRPLPVYGVGYGILPQLEGEAHGVVGTVAKGAAQLFVHATAIGACGQAGDAAAILKAIAVSAKGAVGARGAGEGLIVKFSGSATGRHDDDEAAVIAFLLAA